MKNYPRRHIIESAIEMNGLPIIQTFNFQLQAYDRVLLTTDGVHDVMSGKGFTHLSAQNQSIHNFGDAIVNTLATKKLTDNTSFIILELGV